MGKDLAVNMDRVVQVDNMDPEDKQDPVVLVVKE